jgi:SHS family lactate transporter-like MFS transporter
MGGVGQESEAMVAQEHQQPLHHGMSVGEYLRSRICSLKPPLLEAPNPIRLLRSVDRTQWAFFFVAFAAWVQSLVSLLYFFL